MHILMLLYNQTGKGTYWRALYLARYLAQRGHQIALLATSRRQRWHFDIKSDIQPNVTLIDAPDLLWGALRSGWDPFGALARIKWIHRKPFDIVHAFETRPTVLFPALYSQRFSGTRLVFDWCDWFGRGGSVEERPNRWVRAILRPVETFFEEKFRTWADGTTVINSALYRRSVELGVAPDTILCLPNGSNVEELYPLPKNRARQRLGWPEDLPVIGYIGAIFQRDAVLLAQAFDHIHEVEPGTRLLIAGYCNIDIKSLVAHPDAVIQTGSINYSEINNYLAACNLCWLPMRDSGANRGRFPLKISDYMAVGRPVVVTAVGDVADLVQQGEFGLVAVDQPEDLARQALRLLHDSALSEIMGRRARQVAETKFTWESIAGKLEAFYHQILT